MLVAQSCLTLCNPHGLYLVRLLCPWNSPGKNTGVAIPTPGDLPDPGIKPGSPAIQADSPPNPISLYISPAHITVEQTCITAGVCLVSAVRIPWFC